MVLGACLTGTISHSDPFLNSLSLLLACYAMTCCATPLLPEWTEYSESEQMIISFDLFAPTVLSHPKENVSCTDSNSVIWHWFIFSQMTYAPIRLKVNGEVQGSSAQW